MCDIDLNEDDIDEHPSQKPNLHNQSNQCEIDSLIRQSPWEKVKNPNKNGKYNEQIP